MTQIVRREHRHAGGGAGARERRAEAVAAEALKDPALRRAILARYEGRDGSEDRIGPCTQRARFVFATAAMTRQRPRFSSTSPQVSPSSSPSRIPVASSTSGVCPSELRRLLRPPRPTHGSYSARG